MSNSQILVFRCFFIDDLENVFSAKNVAHKIGTYEKSETTFSE